jgi:exonuclease SbcC
MVAAIHRADGEVVAIQSAIQEEERRHSLARRRIGELEAQLRDAAARSQPAMALATLEVRFRELTADRAAAASHLAHAQTTRQQVSSGVCPFLHEPCRNLRPGVTLDAFFDEEARTWSGQLGALESEYTDVERNLRDARGFELQRVEVDKWRADRDTLQVELADCLRRLSDLEARHQEVSVLIAGRADAFRAEQAALAEIRLAEGASQEFGRLPQLQQEAHEARDELVRTRAEWTATRERLAGSEEVETELRDAIAEAERLGRPREAITVLLPDAARLPSFLANREYAVAETQRARLEASELEVLQQPFAEVDHQIAASRATREATRHDYERYIAAIPLADQLDARLDALAEADRVLGEATSRTALSRAEVDRAAADYDEDAHLVNRRRRADLGTEIGQASAQIELANEDVQRLETELATIATLARELDTLREAAERLDEERNLAGSIRQAVRSTGPEITRRLLSSISRLASSINAEILNHAGIELEWTADYEIVTRRHGETRAFAQLSGGEQMAAALAVRMAAMRLLSNVRVAFLDEPTAHLDQSRRANLGDQVQHLQGFDQLVVISHDDTFDGLFGHLVRINLQDGRSRVAGDS